MSLSNPLREDYVAARDDVRRAEADRSQLLTQLSHVDALFEAARRGETDDDVEPVVRDLAERVEGLAYDRRDLAEAALLTDEPTFETFGVDGPWDLSIALSRLSRDGTGEQFEALVACTRDALAGGGESFGALAELFGDLVDALRRQDGGTIKKRTVSFVDGLEARGVETAADFQDLLEAERGPAYGEDLLSLRDDDEFRTAAIQSLIDAIESGDGATFVAARRPFDRAVRALDAFAASRRVDLEDLTADLTDEYPDDHSAPHPWLDHRTPVLLTPTRLETRFVERTDDEGDPVSDPPTWELLVRVYPDDLHVDTHERALTDAEVERGAWFWEQVWWASHMDDVDTLEEVVPDRLLEGVDLEGFPGDPYARHAAVKERAWNRLAERFGPERTAWVKRAMAPEESETILAGPDEMEFIDDAAVADFEAEMDDLRDLADRRPGSWTRPPRARLLPDQWIAFAETDGNEKVATGNPVQPPLSIGPDPGSLESTADTAEEYDLRTGEIEWVFDFDVAEEVGMALRIPLTDDEVSAGVERLTVLGVSTGLDEGEAATELADLLEAHRYTDGLSVLERGTPTNDTRGDSAASAPSGDESIYERECTRPAIGPDDADADGVRAARLLGIDPDELGTGRPFVFDRVSGAARQSDATAEAANAALWSATWGYYLPHMLVPFDWGPGIDRRVGLLDQLENVRRHFVSYVRGGGPLPTVRVDDQPYGVVPTTVYEDWSSNGALEATPETDVPSSADGVEFDRIPDRDVTDQLWSLLSALRPVWEDAVDRVPSVDSADDPALVASELLSMAGTSYGYRLRDLVGGEALATIDDPSQLQPYVQQAHQETRQQLDSAVGSNAVPRVGDLFTDGHASVVDTSVVGGDLASTLETLRATPFDVLRGGLPGTDLSIPEDTNSFVWLVQLLFGGPDRSLAEVLCYYALLQEYRLARLRIAGHYEFWDVHRGHDEGWRQTPWSLLPEPQVYEDGDLTMWDALEADVPDYLRDHPEYRSWWSIGDMLREQPEVDRPFAELTNAFETLEAAESATVERAVRETLDLASHRYDAWVTSLSTRRLEGLRENWGGGIVVGAYGYVEDLQQTDDDPSKGYVQAPSIDQATAAAVMRSAHDAETEEYGDLFAVDLSAERVRDARTLLEGVRAGYPLGELLGYRFERALHENQLDSYVYPFRSLAPLVEGSIDRENVEDSDAVAERDVVDGVALYELWRPEEDAEDPETEEEIPWGEAVGSEGIALPDPDSDDETETDAYDDIVDELAAIENSLDAVSDVLAAESVYQLVRDSPERSGAALDALARGESVEDLEVIDTPRTGTSCTHRIVSLLDPDAALSQWRPSEAPRARAEPTLEDWVGTLMGDPTRVVCRAAFRRRPTGNEDGDNGGDGNGDVDDTNGGNGDGNDGTDGDGDGGGTDGWRVRSVRLSELGLSALDVVSLVEGDEATWASELEARIGYHLQRTHADLGPTHEIRLSFAPPAEWPDAAALGVDPDDDVGFGELLEVARGIREVVAGSRPVDARDLSVPGEATDDGRIVGDLDDRAIEAYQVLEEALDALDAQVAALAADPETGERVVDDLVALVEGLLALPTGDLEDAAAALDAIDAATLHDELDRLDDVLSGSETMLARDEDGAVVLSADEPVVEGLAGAGEVLIVAIVRETEPRQVTGFAVVETDENGRFRAEFDDDAVFLTDSGIDGLASGDEVTVTVLRWSTGEAVEYEGRYEDDRPPHSPPLSALEQFAVVTDVLDPIADGVGPVLSAVAALDGETVDEAIDVFDADAWSSDAADDLGDVRDAPSVSLPGFDSPPDWETVATVGRAVGEDDLGLEDVEAAGLDSNVPSTNDVDDLLGALEDGIDALADWIVAAGDRPDEVLIAAALDTIREAMLLCADYGVYGSVPLSAEGATREDLETLARQGGSVHDEARDRIEALAVRPDGGDAPEDPDFYVAWLEALFGENFTVLVPFEPTNEAELVDVLARSHSETLQNGDEMAVETWFNRVSRVRDEAGPFGRLLIYGESLGDLSPADGARFSVGQLPYEDDDTWVGLPDAWADDHPTGRLSVVSHIHGSVGGDGAGYVGLFVDEFVEVVPNETETTGLAVHYDRPSNQAPQTVLLAVPPTAENWSVESLADVIRESVDLAKLRTVDRDALADAGQLLPALTLATNESADPAGPDTASVDPDDLMAEWWSLAGEGGGS